MYGRASEWTLSKVAGATGKLGFTTPCDEWDVRELLNHMLETEQFFVGTARGQEVSPPSARPPKLLSDDPVADFQHALSETLNAFSEDGVLAKTGPSLGIAFSDLLLHGWDLAKATGQDAMMPDGLAEAAYGSSTAASPMKSARVSSGPRSPVLRAPPPRTSSSPTQAATHPVERASQLKQRGLDDRADPQSPCACLVPAPA